MEEGRSNQCHPSGKIKPLQLRERYHLQTVELAQQAQVEPRAVYFLWLGYPVTRQEAEQILAAISNIAGQSYTLDNVRVVLVPEDEGQTGPPQGLSPADTSSMEENK